MKPLVSVIIPAYNATRFIEATLESVLNQTYTNLEIIVVDDGSTDNTRELVAAYLKDPRVQLICQQNAGVAAARNRAIDSSKGEFVAPLDADDIWYPEKIEKQVQVMQTNPAIGLVYAWTAILTEQGNLNGDYLAHTKSGKVLRDMLARDLIGCASIPLFRRSCLDDVGYYRYGITGTEDFDLYLRVAEKWEYGVVPEFLIGYRMVKGSMSRKTTMMWNHHISVLDVLQSRHPEIPAHLFRQNKANICAWLADLCRQSGNHMESLIFLQRAVSLNPKQYLFNPRIYAKGIFSLLALLLSPIVKPSQTTEVWEKLKYRIKLRKQISSLTELRDRVNSRS